MHPHQSQNLHPYHPVQQYEIAFADFESSSEKTGAEPLGRESSEDISSVEAGSKIQRPTVSKWKPSYLQSDPVLGIAVSHDMSSYWKAVELTNLSTPNRHCY